MIINHTITEIEHTLYLVPYAKLKLGDIERTKYNKNIEYYHYIFIVKVTEFWLSYCTIDEEEIIEMRFFERKSFESISIILGYKNHSSVERKSHEIIRKISYLAKPIK